MADAEPKGGALETFAWAARALLKRWPIVAALLLLGAGVSLAYSKSLSRIYQASTLLEFDPDAIKPLNDRADPMAAWSRILDTREYYETQYKIIESYSVLSIVIRELGLQNDPEYLGSKPSAPVDLDRAVEELRGRLKVEPVKGSRLVYIRVKHTKPTQARRLSEAIARAYLKQNLEKTTNATSDASVWLSGQLEHFKHELEQTENSLHEFKKENDLPSSTLDDLSKMIRLEMQEYDQALTHTRLKHSELSARQAELSKIDPEKPDEIPASELLSNAFLSQLRNKYQDAQRERAELIAEGKGENHPSVRRANEKVTLAKTELIGEIRTIQGAIARDLAIIRQQESGEAALYETSRRRAVDLNLKELEFHRLDRLRAQNEKLYGSLLEQLKETDLRRMMNINNVRLVDLPVEPRVPISPNVLLNLIIGTAAGLLLGIIIAFVREALDNTLKTPDDIEKRLGVPFLGLIPEMSQSEQASKKKGGRWRRRKQNELPVELVVHEDPTSGIAEAARAVRTNLTFMNPDNPYRRILVTSAAPAEGKTTVATSIAISLAQSGHKVCIIDCDLRRPRLHRIFGRRGDVGLTNLLLGEVTIEQAAKPSVVPNLFSIPCGPIPPSSADIVASEKFRKLLDELSELFDRIVLDSPPVVAVTDAAILSTLVDGVVLVVRAFKTTLGLSKVGLRKLHDVDAKMAGVVLNAVNLERDQYYYEGYYYYRRDGYAPHPAHAAESAAEAGAPPPPN